MKHSLIVTAHPSSHGFVHVIAKNYQKSVKENGETAEILDLYQNPQPFLKFETEKEWPQEQVAEMQKKIAKANEIILCFPVWWGDSPAILKNWLDYNFTAGFAFLYGKKGVQKLLKGKTAKIIATADAPGFAYGFFLSPMRISWSFFRLAFCGMKVKTFKVYGNMRKRDEANRAKILAEIKTLAQK